MKYVFEYIIRYDVLYGEIYPSSSDLEGMVGWIPSEYAHKTYERQIRSDGRKDVAKLDMEFYKRSKNLEELIN